MAWEPFGALGACDVLQDQILAANDLLAEKYEGVAGRVPGRGGDLALHRQVTPEGDDPREIDIDDIPLDPARLKAGR
jgi:hypothetical protein